MKKLLLGAFLTAFYISGSAQENLVVNPSFEILDDKVKEMGSITSAKGWSSATGVAADLFTPEAKIDEAKTPENLYGKEKPYDGNNYAGIKAFVDKDKEPRNYLTGTLTKTLEPGKKYCVKLQQSLSENSKYAISDVAAVFSEEQFEMGDMSYSILMKPHVTLDKPVIVTRQLYWDDLCNVYTADGTENFITIGVFATEKVIEDKKVKRPGDYRGRQESYAYYYIDAVEVRPLQEGEECNCEKEVFVDTPKIVKSTVSSNVSESEVHDQIEKVSVRFENEAFELDPNQEGIEEILKYINLDSGLRLMVTGYISKEEMKKGMNNPKIKNLAKLRAEAVKKYLVEQKVDEKRLTVAAGGDSEAAQVMFKVKTL